MNVYRTTFNYTDYLSLKIDLEDMMFEIGEHIGGPRNFLKYSADNIALAAYWTDDFEGEFIQPDGMMSATKQPDITAWNKANFVMSQAAKNILEPHLGSYGEFLPIAINGKLYFIFNCLNIVEVDEAKSEQQISKNSEFLGVKRIVFSDETIKNNLVFKTRYDRCASIYCIAKFKALLEENNLKGLSFNSDLLNVF